MIADLKPYAEYKESGLPWLGRVPGHWLLCPGFAAFREKKVKNIGMREKTVLSLSYGRIVVKPHERLHGLVPDSFETYQIVEPGDIIIRSTDLQNDWNSLRVGLVRDRGIITSAYLCFRTTDAILPDYGHQLLHTFDLLKVFYGLGSGLRQNLDWTDFKRMLIFIPPPTEQAAIVRFLDWANGRLERAIRAKRKVIALLNEQKQAIIHCAVTRGLDPSVPLKPSGIPWLGDIPQHWEVVALGRLCISRCDGPFGSGLKSAHYTDSGVRVIRLQNIGSGEFRTRDGAFVSAEHYATLGDHGVIEGDLLVAGLGDERIPAGRACVVPRDLGPAMVKADCFRFRMRGSRVVTQFIAAQLSATAAGATACLSTGATRLRINLSATASRSVAIPPAAEQHGILTSIDRAVAPLISTISRLEREITLLREYRTRLVADVVTGKLNVREAAARLPDEAPVDTVEGDADLTDETEAADEEAG
jgi:type I restriction enzyme, S subunit